VRILFIIKFELERWLVLESLCILYGCVNAIKNVFAYNFVIDLVFSTVY